MAQLEFDAGPTPELRSELYHCVAQYVLCTRMHEDFWRQKATIRWIVDGERSTKFLSRLGKIEEGQIEDSCHSGCG